MATQITAGKILRRGVGSLGNDAMEYLLKNKDHVQRINDDFDSRRTVLIEQHAATQAEIAKLEKTEADLAGREGAAVKAQDDFTAATAKADKKHQADGDALARRTSEVVAKETASIERTEALDAREREIGDKAMAQENQIRGRLEALEAQEAAAEERERIILKADVDVTARQKRIETAVKIVKQAAASLR